MSVLPRLTRAVFPRSFPAALAAVAAVALAACSAAPDPSTAPPVAFTGFESPDPGHAERVDPGLGDRVVSWPAVGWYRLEVTTDVVLDESTTAGWTTHVAVWWSDGVFERWIDAPDPADPARRRVDHQRRVGADAAESTAAHRGTFETSLAADGLRAAGVGPSGGRLAVGSRTEEGVTVRQRWELGSDAAPWGPDGPFAARS